MAQQTFNIGAASSEFSSAISWNARGSGHLIDTTLVAGGVSAYLSRLDIQDGTENLLLTLDDSTFGGPDLTEAWEQSAIAVKVEAGTLSVTLTGPNNAGSTNLDPTEPYCLRRPDREFRGRAANNDEQVAFITAYQLLSQADKDATTLTLDDGVSAPIAVALAGDARTGIPTATGNLSVTALGAVALAGDARTGVPTATGNLSVTAPGAVALQGDARTGVPVATGNLTARAFQRLAGRSLTFANPIPASEGVAVGDLLSFGVLGSETIDGLIVGIEPGAELSARVSVLPFSAPGVYDSETGPIPPYLTGLTPLADGRYPLVIENLRSDESALRRLGSTLVPSVAVDVRPVDDANAVIEAQIRPHGDSPWEAADVRSRSEAYIELGGVVEGSSYDMRFRWTVPGRIFSGAWTEELNHTITGRTNPPGPLSDFAVTAESGGYTVSWTVPNDIDLAGVVVYAGASNSFGFAREIGRANASYLRANSLPNVAVNLWARAIDTGGRLGPLSGPLAVTALDPDAGGELHFIGSDSVPSPTLGVEGDTAINDQGEYFVKISTGWEHRGDLTPTGTELHFIGSDDVPDLTLGSVGDTAINDQGTYFVKTPTGWEMRGDLTPGSIVHDIGSADAPAADLGDSGDTAINDAAMYWFKTPTGWDLRGDLTDGHVYFSNDLIAAGHAGTLPPPDAFGFNNDIAIGPNGRVMRRVAGAWVDVTLDIPAPSNLRAIFTLVTGSEVFLGPVVYDLRIDWAGADYLTEVDIGFIPTVDITDLTAASWGELDGITATSFHEFPLVRQNISIYAGQAVRCRHIGSFGQRGPYSYALYSFVGCSRGHPQCKPRLNPIRPIPLS